jgi:hypothetical protein
MINKISSLKIADIARAVGKELAGRPLVIGGVRQALRVDFSKSLDNASVNISAMPSDAYFGSEAYLIISSGGLRRESYADLARRVMIARSEKIAVLADRIVQDVDGDYEDGPCDGAEACDDADEFVDYHMSGYAGQECGGNPDLWTAVSGRLRDLFDAERHGYDFWTDDAAESFCNRVLGEEDNRAWVGSKTYDGGTQRVTVEMEFRQEGGFDGEVIIVCTSSGDMSFEFEGRSFDDEDDVFSAIYEKIEENTPDASMGDTIRKAMAALSEANIGEVVVDDNIVWVRRTDGATLGLEAHEEDGAFAHFLIVECQGTDASNSLDKEFPDVRLAVHFLECALEEASLSANRSTCAA